MTQSPGLRISDWKLDHGQIAYTPYNLMDRNGRNPFTFLYCLVRARTEGISLLTRQNKVTRILGH